MKSGAAAATVELTDAQKLTQLQITKELRILLAEHPAVRGAVVFFDIGDGYSTTVALGFEGMCGGCIDYVVGALQRAAAAIVEGAQHDAN